MCSRRPETLSAIPDLAAEERPEKPFHCRRRNRIARIRHPKLEKPRAYFGSDRHGLVGCSMRQGVANAVAKQMANTSSVAIGSVNSKLVSISRSGRPFAIRPRPAQAPAEADAFGALRLGQCPEASRMTISLPRNLAVLARRTLGLFAHLESR